MKKGNILNRQQEVVFSSKILNKNETKAEDNFSNKFLKRGDKNVQDIVAFRTAKIEDCTFG